MSYLGKFYVQIKDETLYVIQITRAKGYITILKYLFILNY